MTRDEKLKFIETTISGLVKAPIQIVNESALLSEFGLDSLDIVELQIAYEEHTGVDLIDISKPVNTIHDLLELMND